MDAFRREAQGHIQYAQGAVNPLEEDGLTIDARGYYTPSFLKDYPNKGTTIVTEVNIHTSEQRFHCFQNDTPHVQQFLAAATEGRDLPQGYGWSSPPTKKAKN